MVTWMGHGVEDVGMLGEGGSGGLLVEYDSYEYEECFRTSYSDICCIFYIIA